METLSLSTVDAVRLEMPVAGTGSRVLAYLIDWHIRVLIALTLILIAVLIRDFYDSDLAGDLAICCYVAAGLVYVLYQPLLEIVMRGCSPGKRWTGLRIVDGDGAQASSGAILLRNLFRLIDSLPFAYALGLTMMLVRKDSLRLGDLATGTRVVYDAGSRVALDKLPRFSSTLSPQALDLLQEWLARWKTLGDNRDEIARSVFRHDAALSEAAASLSGKALRDWVRSQVEA